MSLGPISGLAPGMGPEKSGLGRGKLKMPIYRAWTPLFACQAPGLVEIQIIIIIIGTLGSQASFDYYSRTDEQTWTGCKIFLELEALDHKL